MVREITASNIRSFLLNCDEMRGSLAINKRHDVLVTCSTLAAPPET